MRTSHSTPYIKISTGKFITCINGTKAFTFFSTESPNLAEEKQGRDRTLIATRSLKSITVNLCTSLDSDSIAGLSSRLAGVSCGDGAVNVRTLPYSGIDDYRFPVELVPDGVMILCHSIHNRGLSITDVPVAIYDKYLKYCHDLFGKKN